MVKKQYIKPVVEEISIAANQAIAACGKIVTGYDNSFARGNNGQFGWPTAQEAWEAYDQYASYEYSNTYDPTNQKPFIFPVVYCETIGPNGQLAYGTFHDTNGNGVMDNGEYFAWQQNDYNSVAGVAIGANAAVMNS